MSWLATLAGILFIGVGPTGPEGPAMLSALVDEHDVNVTVIDGDISGNLDAARKAINLGVYGAVVAHLPTPGVGPDPKQLVGTLTELHEQALAQIPAARLFVTEGWPDLQSGRGIHLPGDRLGRKTWRQRIDEGLAHHRAILDDVNRQRPLGAQPARLIPHAQALAWLSDNVATGRVPGVSALKDFIVDGTAPNHLGNYYLAMIQFAFMNETSPVGLARRLNPKGSRAILPPSPMQAQRLQQIAWEFAETYRDTAPPPEPPHVAATVAEAGQTGFVAPSKFSGATPLAVGASGIADWSTQMPFIDHFKTARSWSGHLPDQFGGVDHHALQDAGYLDAQGWLIEVPPELRMVSALMLTDLPPGDSSAEGRYRLTYDGRGRIQLGGRVSNVVTSKNQIEFDFTPGPGYVDVQLRRSDSGDDYIRNIRVIKLDHLAAFEAGEIFNPDWLRRLEGFDVIRFMTWMNTNHSTQSRWSDRPGSDDYTYSLRGVPTEVMIRLLNQTGMDGWFNMPHMADDDYMRRFARMVRDGLNPDQKAYVELSNEVWNWQFPQATWANDMAKQRWGENGSWVSYYAVRAIQMAQIWKQEFGDQADERLVRVISTQTGWIGLEEQILEAGQWMQESPDNPAPATFFDAYAITGYFSGKLGQSENLPMVRQWLQDSLAAARSEAARLGLRGDKRRAHVTRHRFDLATQRAAEQLRDGRYSGDREDTVAGNIETLWPYHATIAREHGLDLIMYEGGTHVVGSGPAVDDTDLTDFYLHLNYSPEMGTLYSELINGWYAVGGTLFNAFTDVNNPSRWGSWGHLRHLSDDNPRWQALERFK